jgi:hypothetical protein
VEEGLAIEKGPVRAGLFCFAPLLASRWAEIPQKSDLLNVTLADIFAVKPKNRFAD